MTQERLLRGSWTFSLATLALVVVLFLLTVFKPSSSVNFEQEKRLAAVLVENKLYRQAIDAYGKLLQSFPNDPKRVANLHYLIGSIFSDHLNAPEEGLAQFLMARALDPKSEFQKELSQRIVTSYERLGRTDEAKRELEKATALETKPVSAPEKEVVATIGKRQITRKELERELQFVPPEVRQNFPDTKEGRRNFLNQYLGLELLYESAKRRGYADDSAAITYGQRAQKEYATERVITEDIAARVAVTPDEVKKFYEQNKKKFGGKPFSAVADSVTSLVRANKQKELYLQTIQNLWEKEKVQVFDERL